MEMKRDSTVPLEHYADLEEAEEDLVVLEDAGFHPIIWEEPHEFEAGVSLFVLEVPDSEYEDAYDTLMRHWEVDARFPS